MTNLHKCNSCLEMIDLDTFGGASHDVSADELAALKNTDTTLIIDNKYKFVIPRCGGVVRIERYDDPEWFFFRGGNKAIIALIHKCLELIEKTEKGS